MPETVIASGGTPAALTILQGEHAGPCIARNRAIAISRGSLLIFFNDDVVPERTCIAHHLDAQHKYNQRRETDCKPTGALISGDSPWKARSPETYFSQMLHHTGMVFFHHAMRDSTDPCHNWGFRHAWMLNISIPADAVRAVGGLHHVHSSYGRDDDELAHRLTTQLDMPVLFCPQAVAVHDHPMTPEQYLQREYQLGLGAPTFAHHRPQCAHDMFGRDILECQYLEFARGRAADATPQLKEWFLALDTIEPPSNISDLAQAYTRHLPLKRAAWLKGYEQGLAHLRCNHANAAA